MGFPDQNAQDQLEKALAVQRRELARGLEAQKEEFDRASSERKLASDELAARLSAEAETAKRARDEALRTLGQAQALALVEAREQLLDERQSMVAEATKETARLIAEATKDAQRLHAAAIAEATEEAQRLHAGAIAEAQRLCAEATEEARRLRAAAIAEATEEAQGLRAVAIEEAENLRRELDAVRAEAKRISRAVDERAEARARGAELRLHEFEAKAAREAARANELGAQLDECRKEPWTKRLFKKREQ